ncbi:MAG: aldo/keto reductase [Candidatus Hodarchaeales archaeon]|jgi:aryl-alcohol dehydrogenase-like predicted oxidoreductase
MRNLYIKGSKKQVSPLGMGCWAIGGPFKTPDGRYFGYGTVKDEESIKVIHKAIDLGINFFDTADVYGAGHSEKILGEALSEYRDEAVIATKFGSMFEKGNRTIYDKHTSSSEYIKKAVLDSCKRLKTDFIDLYQYHWWECPFDETIKVRDTLEDLVSDGVIGGYGWSTDDVKRAEIFAEGKNCIGMQYILNFTTNNQKMINLCEKYNLLSVIRSPLGYGLLTGKYSDNYKLADKHWLKYMNLNDGYFANMKKFATLLKKKLTEDGRTLAQAALGYIWALSESTIPIPGAKNIKQIEENSKALEFGPLDQDTMKFIKESYSSFSK